MNVAVKWGLILGIVVGLMGFVFAGAGLHTRPMMALVFVGLAIVVNVVVVVLALRQTAATTGWGGQWLNGIVIGAVGAVIIFACSYIMTTVVFPDYYAAMRQGYLEFFEGAGMTDAQIDAQMKVFEGATAFSSAMQGAIGTVLTSVVVSGLGGIFLRRK